MIKRIIVTLVLLIVLVAVFLGTQTLLPAIGTPSPTALSHAVFQQILATQPSTTQITGTKPCVLRRLNVYECPVQDALQKSNARYRVQLRGSRCFRARKLSSNDDEKGGPPFRPAAAQGCVHVGDQMRLSERLGLS